jgi:hypothetical protein
MEEIIIGLPAIEATYLINYVTVSLTGHDTGLDWPIPET